MSKNAICWQCKAPLDQENTFFCGSCQALQPPRAQDAFQFFGVSYDYDLDAKILEQKYLSFQRQVHPDRFALKSAQEKLYATHTTSQLNDSYEILKDSIKRAYLLLKVNGFDDSENSNDTISDPGLLMQAMEDQEKLENLDSVHQLEEMRQDMLNQYQNCLDQLNQTFKNKDFQQAQKLAYELKYISKIVSDICNKKLRIQ